MKNVILIFIIFFLIYPNQEESKEDKALYILFKKNIDGMAKWAEGNQDSAFYYQIRIDRAFWYGFKPVKEGEVVSKESFFKNKKEVLRDINWLRNVSANYPDSLFRKKNIFIIEDLGSKVKVIPCSFFKLIE